MIIEKTDQLKDDFFTMLGLYLIFLIYGVVELYTKTNTFLFVGLILSFIYLGYWCYLSFKNLNLSKLNKIIRCVLVGSTILPIFILSFSYATVSIIEQILKFMILL